ncbi:MAG: hypothetical protein ACI9WS_002753 [Paraglaciecola psychrophila]|jgi:hypothetical protein
MAPQPHTQILEKSINAMRAIAKVHGTDWNDPMLEDSQYDTTESTVDIDVLLSE